MIVVKAGKLLLLAFLLNPHLIVSGETVEELFNIKDPQTVAGSHSTTFGFLDVSAFPWVNSVSLGWLYVHENSSRDNLYLWHQWLGWFYTTSNSFPKAYLYGTSLYTKYTPGEWILIDLTNAAEVKYFNLSGNYWRLLNSANYDPIPSDLQGIVATDHGFRATYFLIGKYLMIRRFYGTLGILEDTFAYDRNSGLFYPITQKNVSVVDIDLPNNLNIRLIKEGDILKSEVISGWTEEVISTMEYEITGM